MTLEELIYSEPFPSEGKKWEYSKKLAADIRFWFMDNLNKCPNIECDNGKVCSDRINPENHKFYLEDCENCGGKGWV